MVDLAEGMESRNYRFRYRTDPRCLWDLLAMSLSLLMVAGTLVFCIWVSFQIVDIGYSMQELQREEEKLRKALQTLDLEEDTLKQPQAIDAIARGELGMSPMKINQILPPASLESDMASATALAMVSSPQRAGGQKNRPAN